MSSWEQNTEPEASSSSGQDTWGAAATATNINGGHDGAAPVNGTNGSGDASATATDTTGGLSRDELIQRARDHGWAERQAYDYERFNGAGNNADGYHGAARVYEWQGDYGDVGPEIPELETILFGDEFQMRRGEHLEALDVTAMVEARENLRVDKVRLSLYPISDSNGTYPLTLINSSRMRASILLF